MRQNRVVCDLLIAGRFFEYQFNSALQPSPIFLRPSSLHRYS